MQLHSSTFATRYVILRGLKPSCTIVHDVPEEPIRVLTLRDEKKFLERDGEIVHHDTVFIEDRLHDWQWESGRFRYFARQSDGVDVVLVYEEEVKVIPPNFCCYCGVSLKEHPDHDYTVEH